MFTKDAGGADSILLGLVPVETNKTFLFPFKFADKFSDDAVFDTGDAGSAYSTGSAGLALVFPLTLASSSGFLSIFFVGLVNVAMVNFVNVAMDDLAQILFYFVFVS
jgi:hypothetical protein